MVIFLLAFVALALAEHQTCGNIYDNCVKDSNTHPFISNAYSVLAKKLGSPRTLCDDAFKLCRYAEQLAKPPNERT